MISLLKKEDCCGCTACAEKCPKQSISIIEDQEGFSYPEINPNTCIDCGLCEKVCPVINQWEEHLPLKIYAIQNKDEVIRMQSSSGGIFTLLAEQTIKEQGVVFGAKFNECWEVMHDYTETIEGLSFFRKSKYVQSQIGQTYRQTQDFLKQGRKVLYSGTPCQITGLKRFLQKEYDNLLTIDFICHGVPSPKVWKKYLHELNSIKVQNINFRNKQNGWKNYNIEIQYNTISNKKSIQESVNKNVYMKGFLSNLYLRPSCHKCPAKSLKSGSDITLADFWGIWDVIPTMFDDKGSSLITLNSDKAIAISELFKNCQIQEMNYEIISKYNKAFSQSCQPSTKRSDFFAQIDQVRSINKLINKCLKISFRQRIKNKLNRFFTK